MNKEGWGWVKRSPLYHYFILGSSNKSLCGKWGLFNKGSLDKGNDESEGNCKKCLEVLNKVRRDDGQVKNRMV